MRVRRWFPPNTTPWTSPFRDLRVASRPIGKTTSTEWTPALAIVQGRRQTFRKRRIGKRKAGGQQALWHGALRGQEKL